MLGPLDDLGTTWDLLDEVAEPGYYAATLSSGVRCEVTVGPKSAVHRYTFPADDAARIDIDASTGGLAIPHSRTVPLQAHLAMLEREVAQGETQFGGVHPPAHLEVDAAGWRPLPWY